MLDQIGDELGEPERPKPHVSAREHFCQKLLGQQLAVPKSNPEREAEHEYKTARE